MVDFKDWDSTRALTGAILREEYGVEAWTVPRGRLVPTATKPGVSTTPCGVWILPTRARLPSLRDACSSSKSKNSRGRQGAKAEEEGG